MKETIIKVNGMMCNGCENRIKNAIKEINGVENVEANFKTGIVKVLANNEVKTEKLEETIEDIGFEVEK